MEKFEKAVPDTSVVIEGLLSKMIEKKELKISTLLIHEAVLAELESQANKNRGTGFMGLQEIEKLRELSKKSRFKIEYKGNRPGDFEIKFAKSGEIDSLIRLLAQTENATLITADIVQATVARAKGIPVYLYEFPTEEPKLMIEKYFDSNTMSVHIRQDCVVKAKIGSPGKWKYTDITKKVLTQEEVKLLYVDVIENAKASKDGFIETERKSSIIAQIGRFRIVLCKPPLSDGYEITAVRPVKTLKFEDYKMSEKLKERLMKNAEGILVSGAPGQGKTTFIQALALKFLNEKKSIRTIESPRDLDVPVEISQYSMNYSIPSELQNILLLSRPDYTFFDEVRNTEDFRLFKDLRLSGIGMVGVIHATKPIDAIQRFVGRIELGIIPHILDTVVFISEGKISKAFRINIEVKVPSGMTESDLARPIVTVYDFDSGKLEFEIYSYGEETVVMPVIMEKKSNPLFLLAEKKLKEELSKYDADVELINEFSAVLRVDKEMVPELLGRARSNINSLQKKYGLSFKVLERAKRRKSDKQELEFSVETTAKDLILKLKSGNEDKPIDIFIEDDFLMSAKASKKGIIKMSLTSGLSKVLFSAIKEKKSVRVLG